MHLVQANRAAPFAETEPAGKAADETRELYRYPCRQLNLPAPRKRKADYESQTNFANLRGSTPTPSVISAPAPRAQSTELSPAGEGKARPARREGKYIAGFFSLAMHMLARLLAPSVQHLIAEAKARLGIRTTSSPHRVMPGLLPI